MDPAIDDPHALIDDVKRASAAHADAWARLVPDSYLVNFAAEAEEERAYDVMAAAKARLRAHVQRTYGLSIGDLATLAHP